MPAQLVSLSYDCCFHAFVSFLLRIRKHNGFTREANMEFCELPVFLSLVFEYPWVLDCVAHPQSHHCSRLYSYFANSKLTCRPLSEIVSEPYLHRYGIIVYFHPNCILPVLFQCHLHGHFRQLLLPWKCRFIIFIISPYEWQQVTEMLYVNSSGLRFGQRMNRYVLPAIVLSFNSYNLAYILVVIKLEWWETKLVKVLPRYIVLSSPCELSVQDIKAITTGPFQPYRPKYLAPVFF